MLNTRGGYWEAWKHLKGDKKGLKELKGIDVRTFDRRRVPKPPKSTRSKPVMYSKIDIAGKWEKKLAEDAKHILKKGASKVLHSLIRSSKSSSRSSSGSFEEL